MGTSSSVLPNQGDDLKKLEEGYNAAQRQWIDDMINACQVRVPIGRRGGCNVCACVCVYVCVCPCSSSALLNFFNLAMFPFLRTTRSRRMRDLTSLRTSTSSMWSYA